MPQLDKATFFSQVTWAFLVYFVLYYFLSAYVCPAVGRALKLRARLDLGSAEAVVSGSVNKQSEDRILVHGVHVLSSSEVTFDALRSACLAKDAAVFSTIKEVSI